MPIMPMPLMSQPQESPQQAPPFLNTVPSVVARTNIDIENDLRNATRRNTKCACGKYHPKI